MYNSQYGESGNGHYYQTQERFGKNKAYPNSHHAPTTASRESHGSNQRQQASSISCQGPQRSDYKFEEREKQRKERAERIQNQEYIDPLATAPRTESCVVQQVAKIVSRFVMDNDRIQALALQFEVQPQTMVNTSPHIIEEAQARMVIHRRQLVHSHASHFHVLMQANLTIESYFKRLQKYFHCSPECFILAFIYIDRAVTMNRDSLTLCSQNIHRLVLAALTVATKYWDDIYYSNFHYARVGGVSTKELDNLEYQLLCLTNWRLFVDPTEYKGYLQMIKDSPLSAE